MIALKERQDVYLKNFRELEQRLAGREPSWVTKMRRAAIERFSELGFPTTHHEEWKYTNVEPIARVQFQPALRGANLGGSDRIPFTDFACPRLVFVNGRYSKELSSPLGLPPGVRAGGLASILSSGSPALEEHLGRYADIENHAFVALNSAFIEDGAFIELAKDVVLVQPILLLFVAAVDGAPLVAHPRNLILAGRGSQASFIEAYVGLEVAAATGNAKGQNRNSSSNFDLRVSSFEKPYFTNAVTEIAAGEGAVIDYAKVQMESESAFHVATIQAHQARSSSVTTRSIALGGALVREDVNIVLDGEGAESRLHGLYVLGGRQHVDNHTTIDHARPHCGSREVYKGVLDGHSTGVFNGKIIVRKDAQKTDSKQSNKNLLLSEDAVINTKPQLEIYADDVKCTHGATIGQVDPEAVFYLRSRGIGLEEARSLLVRAFAGDVINQVKFEPLGQKLHEALQARLAHQPESEARSQEPATARRRVSTLVER